MEQWKDKVALVTGASSGMGQSIALSLLNSGMRLVACDLHEDKLHNLKKNIKNAHYLPIAIDLRDESKIMMMFEKIRQEWGGVDVLINNAGIGHLSSLITGKTELWREIIEVNILALCICTREAIKDMRRRDDKGYIINICSTDAHVIPPDGSMYAASKSAVRTLTYELREELLDLKSNIRVTAISPGRTETNFLANYLKDAEKMQNAYQEYKALEPKDIANTVIHVLSQPGHVQFQDLVLYPLRQPSFYRTPGAE